MIKIFKDDALNQVVQNAVNEKLKDGYKVDDILLEEEKEDIKPKLVVDNAKGKKI